MFLSTLTFCAYVTASLQRWATWPKETINQLYGDSFTSRHIPFSFFENVQLPEIGQAAFILAAHLYVNLAALGKIKIRGQLTNIIVRMEVPIGPGYAAAVAGLIKG